MEEDKREAKKNEEIDQKQTQQQYDIIVIISIIFSIIGLFCYSFPCGVVALVTGIIGLIRVNKSNKKTVWKWIAIISIILGVIEILYFLIILFLGTSIFLYNYNLSI